MKKPLNKLLQFIKFGLVGGLNTVISLVIYYLLVYLGVHYIASTIAGYVLSSAAGYMLNKIWVFKAKEIRTASSLVKYYVVYGSSLILNMGLMYLWVDILSVSDKIAPLLTMCFTVPFNFIFSKLWIFRTKRVTNKAGQENNEKYGGKNENSG